MSSFFIPILAYLVWIGVVFSYSPVWKLDLALLNPLIASHIFISYFILVLALALSGPVTAAILGIFSSAVALYLGLGMKEPALFLQPLIYAVLFFILLSYLQAREKEISDKGILKEKLIEDIHMAKAELLRKEQLKIALEKKIDRFLDLHQFTGELKSKKELHEAAESIVQEVRRSLAKAEECVLYLVDEAQEALSLVASSGSQEKVVKEKEGGIFDQWVMKKSQGLMIEDAQNDFRFSAGMRPPLDRIRSVALSPLMTENKVLGVLRVSAGQPSMFNADDLRLLDIFSSLAAVNLRNILLYEKMEELAIRDSLTGLYLNRYFQQRFSEEVQRAYTRELYFSLVLLDLDHFKRINDEYGHTAGDIVLKNVAAILLRCVGAMDLVARYGGEEFAVLLPNKNKTEALGVAEKMRTEMEKSRFLFRRVEGYVTISIGVAAFPEGGRSKEELLRRADKNLYEAKRRGRNQVCGNI